MTTVLFVQIPNKSLLPGISAALKNYLPVQNMAREDFRINRFSLIPLKDVGSNTRNIWSSGLFPSLHPAALFAPSIMAIFILLIACFNFANTSVAIFSRRLKEIGLRKTFGGQRRQLVVQFMLETFLICFLALILAIALASVLVPAILSLIGMYNLVSIDIIRRTKEVGIRKIQDASVPAVIFLISRKFLIVLLIASVLGCAGGYYMSVGFMDSIWDYFVGIGPGILLSAVLIMVVATILTLSVRITSAAMKNPADSLRYE